ncbi:unnamed protein product [Rotaria sp. Silwood2]|nr:unnamed protein product [Rotaria sp. Silwood2]
MTSPILLQAQKESHRNLQSFTGDLTQDVDEYIERIENIGSLTNEPGEVLQILLKEKLTGQAERWFKDNQDSLTTWSTLRTCLRERFQQPWLNQTLFSTLDNRKQEAHESVNDYYDVVCRLCRRIDPKMSKQMILHFLQKGVRDEIKTNITRLMLTDNDPTPETFLKFAKIEEHVEKMNQSLDTNNTYFNRPTESYMMTSAVKSSSTAKQYTNHMPPLSKPYSLNQPPVHENSNYYQPFHTSNVSQNYALNNRVRSYQGSQVTPLSPCLICGLRNHRTIECYQRQPDGCFKSGSDDGTDSVLYKKPSLYPSISSTPIPVYIKVQVNNVSQHAIVDTGSCTTIIHEHLRKKIHHKKFLFKRKKYQSASCTSVNIIGEVELEIKVNGHKTFIVADVASNLIANLLLGHDWLKTNQVNIDLHHQCLTLNHSNGRTTNTPILDLTELQHPVLLLSQVTISPYSEKMIDVTIPSMRNRKNRVLFEPSDDFKRKSIFAINALLHIKHNQTKISVINATDHSQTLPKNSKLGSISYQSSSVCLTLPNRSHHENIRLPDCFPSRSDDNQHPRCYVCYKQFLTGNDLQFHLQATCYPQEMRKYIDNLTGHIENGKHRSRLKSVLWRHGKLFDLRTPSVIQTTLKHAIDTGHHKPIYTPPYRQSNQAEELLTTETNKLLQQGIIEPSISPWSSPVVLVKKKDGTHRFCVDFTKLNAITERDHFPLPRIDDIFDQLSDSHYFTTLDFKSGYFQVPLDKRDRSKTAFSTRDSRYQFTVLPQGITNGPPTFQRIVNNILGSSRWKYSLAYLDDVIIYSSSFNEHLEHLDDILARLSAANFRLNIDKCKIARSTIKFLGHQIDHGNIKPDHEKIQALLATNEPKTSKEAFRFVKAAEYYRKFIREFSQIALPLYKYAPQTKQQGKRPSPQKITLSEEDRKSFNELKRILTTDLILRIPNNNLEFKLQTDASDDGIGAVLLQTYPTGDLPLAYYSQKFSSTQKRWSTTEKECFAILSSIEKWHKYLDGREFILETDHKPLLQLNIQAQHNAKCERWRLKLQQYRFKIKHIKGNENTMADYLSRSPIGNYQEDIDDFPSQLSKSTQTSYSPPIVTINAVTTRATTARINSMLNNDNSSNRILTGTNKKRLLNKNTQQNGDARDNAELSHPASTTSQFSCISHTDSITSFTMDDILKQQQSDVTVQHIIRNIDKYKKYFVDNGMLMRQQAYPLSSVPYISDRKLRANIIRIYHDTPANGAHFGRFKTTRKIQERFYWPSITRDIRLHIRSCIPCLQNNHQRRKTPGFLKPIAPPEGIWQLLAMDFHGPIVPSSREGHKYIISITDILSKFVITKAVKDCSALTASKFLIYDVILKYGTPRAILTDRGTHFTAALMNDIFKQLGVTHILATPYHPSTNGQIERYNATMDAKIAALSNDRRSDWNEKLPFVTFNYNTTIHATSNNIPFNMMYGRSPLLPFDYHTGIVSLPSEKTYMHDLNKYLSMITNNARYHILNQQTKYKIRWSRALLGKYSYTKSIRTNCNKVHDDQCCSEQQTSSDEVISSQQINNNNIHTYTIEDYESISDDDINNTINATILIPVSKSTNDEPGTKIRHAIKIEHQKKRSHAAIRRRCRKRNAIIHAHRHDFDIIRTVYRCFTIREIENILDHLHIRRRHCHIRHHYKLHIGVRSYEDKLRYENVLNSEYFTKEHYIRQLHYTLPFSHNDPDNV